MNSDPSENFSPDQPDPHQVHVYQEVTYTSWGDRLLKSIAGMLVGLLLFVGSFLVLYFNEGSTDFSQVASRAEVVNPAVVQPQAAGKIVALTGSITGSQPLGDNLYLKPGEYVALTRTVEMFAWTETQETESRTNAGGSETKVTTYRYSTGWTDQPQDSRKFRKENYVNPDKAIDNQTFTPPTAQIGAYRIETTGLTEVVNFPLSCTSDDRRYTINYAAGIKLPSGNRLNLTAQNLLPSSAQAVGNYLFQGSGTPTAPRVGDLRICYNALPNSSTVTVFGQLQNGQIGPGQYQNQPFFRLSYGNRETAIASLRSDYLWRLWILRLLGFLMMWGGLAMLVDPINVLLSVIPFLGSLSELMTGATSLIMAFILSLTTILVSSLLHQPMILLVSVGVTGAVLLLGRVALKAARSA